jgi:hypothetical protein
MNSLQQRYNAAQLLCYKKCMQLYGSVICVRAWLAAAEKTACQTRGHMQFSTAWLQQQQQQQQQQQELRPQSACAMAAGHLSSSLCMPGAHAPKRMMFARCAAAQDSDLGGPGKLLGPPKAPERYNTSFADVKLPRVSRIIQIWLVPACHFGLQCCF